MAWAVIDVKGHILIRSSYIWCILARWCKFDDATHYWHYDRNWILFIFLLLKITRLNMFWIISVIMKCISYKCTKVMSSLTIIYNSTKFIFNIYTFSCCLLFVWYTCILHCVILRKTVCQVIFAFETILSNPSMKCVSISICLIQMNCTKRLPWKISSVHLILPHALPSPR